MAKKSGFGNEIKKLEKDSLVKFKNQNKVLKKFGKEGLKVYRSVRKRGITIEELLEKTQLPQDKLFEILLFLKEKKMIETVGKIEEPQVDSETEMVEPEGIMLKSGKKPPKAEKKEKTPPATIAPPEEISPPEDEQEIAPAEVELEEDASIAPEAETIEAEDEDEGSEEFAPIEEKKDELPPADDEVAPLDLGEDEEIAPLSLDKKDEDEGLVPLDIGEEEEEASEEEAELSEEEDQIAPHQNLGGDNGDDEDDEDIFLTPGERKIKAEYGQVGIDVYNLIDGQRTAEEIMKSTGITETKLIEMLDFMEKKGIIKLEHPGTKKASAKLPSSPKPKEVGFAPMLEERPMPGRPLGGEMGKQFTLDVPSKTKGNMFKEMQMKANLMIKYKQKGAKVYELINGSRDAVELSLKTDLPLYRVYKVLNYLVKEGMVTLKPATRDEIKRKYGEDGYSVYKKYGREGVMLYQLIGKDMDLREMALQTSEDNKLVVEIFMFIHKLLGIDLPIDEDVLLERLESPPQTGKK